MQMWKKLSNATHFSISLEWISQVTGNWHPVAFTTHLFFLRKQAGNLIAKCISLQIYIDYKKVLGDDIKFWSTKITKSIIKIFQYILSITFQSNTTSRK